MSDEKPGQPPAGDPPEPPAADVQPAADTIMSLRVMMHSNGDMWSTSLEFDPRAPLTLRLEALVTANRVLRQHMLARLQTQCLHETTHREHPVH